jgi:hypothetical protein
LDAPPTDLGRPLPAQGIAAALQDGEGERRAEEVGQERQVLLAQLVLEGLGRRGHHHRAAREHRRHQIGQRLAGARPGLDDQVAIGLDGPGHGPGHGQLLGSGLTGRQGLGHLGQPPGRGALQWAAGVIGLVGRGTIGLHRPIMPDGWARPGRPPGPGPVGARFAVGELTWHPVASWRGPHRFSSVAAVVEK